MSLFSVSTSDLGGRPKCPIALVCYEPFTASPLTQNRVFDVHLPFSVYEHNLRSPLWGSLVTLHSIPTCTHLSTFSLCTMSSVKVVWNWCGQLYVRSLEHLPGPDMKGLAKLPHMFLKTVGWVLDGMNSSSNKQNTACCRKFIRLIRPLLVLQLVQG